MSQFLYCNDTWIRCFGSEELQVEASGSISPLIADGTASVIVKHG